MKIYLSENHKQKLMKRFTNIFNFNNKILQKKYIRVYSKEGIFNIENQEISELKPVEKDTYKINDFCGSDIIVDESYFKSGNRTSIIPLLYKSVRVDEFHYSRFLNIKEDNETINKKITLVFEMNENSENCISFFYIKCVNIDIKNKDDYLLLSNFLNNLF